MRERTIILVIVLCVTTGMLWATPAHASSRDGTAESLSLQLVNEERQARGLRTLQAHTRMASIARRHSERMAADGELRHNDDLPAEVGSFRALGENVGYGQDADSVHAAFMNSSSHRSIILGNRYTHLGVGAIRDGDLVWITQVFYTPERDSEPTPRAPRRRPAPARVERETVTRSSAETVRAQAADEVRPVDTSRPHRRSRALPRGGTRTVFMLEALAAIDEPVGRSTFVARPPIWG